MTVTFRRDVETPDSSKSIERATFDQGDVREIAFLSPESKGSNDKENNDDCADEPYDAVHDTLPLLLLLHLALKSQYQIKI